MIKWTEFSTSSKHLIVLTPAFFLWMFINSGIYQPIHSKSIISTFNTQYMSYSNIVSMVKMESAMMVKSGLEKKIL